MRFSTREDCLVPVPRSLAQAANGTALARARQPAACFASISDALQQVQQDRSSQWTQDSHPAAAQVASIVEPKTGFEYQPEYCQRGRSQCGQLAGVGVRSKRVAGIKNINVYAVGLYLDGNGARQALQRFRGQSAAELAGNQAFFDEVIQADVSKTLALTISFGRIKAEQFWSTFQERLGPLMMEKGDMESMETFGKVFDGIKFRKGLTLTFCFDQDMLTSKIDGREAGTVRSRALCESLQTIYMGPDPVAPDAKASFAEGIARMLED